MTRPVLFLSLLLILLLFLVSVVGALAQEKACEDSVVKTHWMNDMIVAEQQKKQTLRNVRVSLDRIEGLHRSGEPINTPYIRSFFVRVLILMVQGGVDMDLDEFYDLAMEAFGSSEKLLNAVHADLFPSEDRVTTRNSK